MNKNELKKVIDLLNDNIEYYSEKDLSFDNFNEKEFNIYFYENYQNSWDGEYNCEILEIFEVFKNNEFIGNIGRKISKNMYGVKQITKFNFVDKKIVCKFEWELLE